MSALPTPIRPIEPTPGTTLLVISPEQLRQIVRDEVRAGIADGRAQSPWAILPSRPLNQSELARLLRRSTEHIRQLEQRGELESFRSGQEKLFPVESIAAYLRRLLDGRP